MIRVADYIMKRIHEEGVNHVFYVPGGQCVYLTDALRRNEDIEGIAVHHEQSAAMAALAYSLYNEKMGACLVTTGCAGTNTMTALLRAWQESIPCIFVSGQQNFSQTIKASGLPLRQVGVQEADTENIMKPLTKFSITVESADRIAWYMDKAIIEATTGRKGPVWLDIPLDIQNAIVNEDKLERYSEEAPGIMVAEDEEISFVADAIKNAKRPVVLAGYGTRMSGAVDEIKEFAAKFKMPILFTRFSYDILPYDNEYNFGIVSGLCGASRYANFAIQNSDLVISIGSRLSIDTTGGDFESFAREAKIIVVDIDEIEHSKKAVKIDKLILSDAKAFLQKINAIDGIDTDFTEWVDKCRHWKEILPAYDSMSYETDMLDSKYVMRRISEKLPEKTTVVSDAGLTGASAPSQTRIKEGQRIIHAFAQGEMGASLPNACGIATLCEGPVIAYTGDGSIMMNLQEFQTVVRNNFNIKTVIINNNGYSGVRHGQKAHFRGKSIGTDPGNGVDFPNFGKISDAFGIEYYKATNEEELSEGIEKMFASDNPFVFEVVCDPNLFDLHNGLVTYGKRKYGFRPIEDQSPFIDREVFFEEMIVKPLETSYGTPV